MVQTYKRYDILLIILNIIPIIFGLFLKIVKSWTIIIMVRKV